MKRGIYRAVFSAKWDDPWHQELSVAAKVLFDYCITNHRQTACGVFEASLRQIAFETGIPETKLGKLFEQLSPKVQRWPAHKLYFVRNFYQYQRRTSGPDFTIGAIKAMQNLPDEVKCVVIEVYQELGVTTNAGEGKTSTHEIGGWDRGWDRGSDGTSEAVAEQRQKQNSTAAEAVTRASAPAGLAGNESILADDFNPDYADLKWAEDLNLSDEEINAQTQKWRMSNSGQRIQRQKASERWRSWMKGYRPRRPPQSNNGAGGSTRLKIAGHHSPQQNALAQLKARMALDAMTTDEYERWCVMSEPDKSEFFRLKKQAHDDQLRLKEDVVLPGSQATPSPSSNRRIHYAPAPTPEADHNPEHEGKAT